MESEGRIYVGGSGQTARIWAVKMKFPPNKSFTFDIRYYVDDETEVSTVRDQNDTIHSHDIVKWETQDAGVSLMNCHALG